MAIYDNYSQNQTNNIYKKNEAQLQANSSSVKPAKTVARANPNSQLATLPADTLDFKNKQSSKTGSESSANTGKYIAIASTVIAGIAAIKFHKNIASGLKKLGQKVGLIAKEESGNLSKASQNTEKEVSKFSNNADINTGAAGEESQKIKQEIKKEPVVNEAQTQTNIEEKVEVTKTTETVAQVKKETQEAGITAKSIDEALANKAAGCEKTKDYMEYVHSSPAYAEAIKLGKFDVTKILDVGGESVIFELKDGNVLKLSLKHYDESNPHFNIPEVARGIIELEGTHFTRNKEVKDIKYVIQRKGEMNVSPEDIDKFLKNEITDKGYKITDMHESQFAYFTDEQGQKAVKIVDLGCVGEGNERLTFNYINKTAQMPAGKGREFDIFTLLRDEVMGKEFDYQKHAKPLRDKAKELNEKLEKGANLFDEINALRAEKNLPPVRTFN